MPVPTWAMSQTCLELVVCQVLIPSGPGSESALAFHASLEHVTRRAGLPLPRVHEVCSGANATDLNNLPLYRHQRTHSFLRHLRSWAYRGEPTGTCTRILALVESADSIWNESPHVLMQQWSSLAGHGKVLLGTQMSCWLGKACNDAEEQRFAFSSESPSRFLGIGMIGEVAPLRAAYDRMARLSTEFKLADESYALSLYAHEAVATHAAVVDDRQDVLGSLLVAMPDDPQDPCPGRCLHQHYLHHYYCGCLSCAGSPWGCKSNAGLYNELHDMFIVDDECRLVRSAAQLSAKPTLWHGNGPGKITLEEHLPELFECFRNHKELGRTPPVSMRATRDALANAGDWERLRIGLHELVAFVPAWTLRGTRWSPFAWSRLVAILSSVLPLAGHLTYCFGTCGDLEQASLLASL